LIILSLKSRIIALRQFASLHILKKSLPLSHFFRCYISSALSCINKAFRCIHNAIGFIVIIFGYIKKALNNIVSTFDHINKVIET